MTAQENFSLPRACSSPKISKLSKYKTIVFDVHVKIF